MPSWFAAFSSIPEKNRGAAKLAVTIKQARPLRIGNIKSSLSSFNTFKDCFASCQPDANRWNIEKYLKKEVWQCESVLRSVPQFIAGHNFGPGEISELN